MKNAQDAKLADDGESTPDDQLPFEALRESGLLWLINRTVFHPRGFALALDIGRESGEAKGWALIGDGTEPWHTTVETDDELFAKAEAFLNAHRPHGEATS